jgi:hypothetical protein
MDQSALLRHLAEAYDSLETVSLAPKGRMSNGSRASPRGDVSVLTDFKPVSSISKPSAGRAQRPTSAPAGIFPDEYLFGTPRTDAHALTLPSAMPATPPTMLSNAAPVKHAVPTQHRVPVLQGIREDEVAAPSLPARSPRNKATVQPEEQPLYKLDLAYLSGTAATEKAGTQTLVASPPHAAPRAASASSPRKFQTTPSTETGTSNRAVSTPDAASSPRYVYTGQRRQNRTDPNSPYLTWQYKLSLKHVVTSQGEYGYFAKTLARTRRKQSKLREKQLNSTK